LLKYWFRDQYSLFLTNARASTAKLYLKKIIAILFFSIFLCSQLAYYAVTLLRDHEQARIEKHFLGTLADKDCEIINYSLQQHEIKWIEEGNAFYLHGVMYDVVKMELKNGQVQIHCIKEAKEMEMLADLIPKISADDNFSGHILNWVFASDYIMASETTGASIPFFPKAYALYYINLSDSFTAILLPPPRSGFPQAC
jgi:hypothetical protein